MKLLAVFAISLALFLVLNRTGDAQKEKFQDQGETLFPDSVIDVSPVNEPPKFSRDEAVSEEKEHNQGKYWDDETYRKLKEKAKWDPKVPKGDQVITLAEGEIPIQSVFRFSGITHAEAQLIPPDTNVAVGPEQVIEATNGRFRLSSKSNTNIESLSLGGFFNSTKLVFDPKIYYDRLSKRFFLTAGELGARGSVSSDILIAVSQSDRPQNLQTGWCKYRFSGASGNTYADRPTIGMNGNWLVINIVNFTFGDFVFYKSFLKVIPKKSLVNNGNSCPKIKVFSFEAPNADHIEPVQHLTDDSDAYAVGISRIPGPTQFILYKISGTVRPQLRSKKIISSVIYSMPPDAPHPNGQVPLDTGTTEILQAVFRNGKIWTSQTTGCNIGPLPNESCARFIRFNAEPPAIEEVVTLGAGPNRFIWVPSVAVNKNGDIASAVQHSSKTKSLSAGMTGKKANATKMEPLKLFSSGNCPLADYDGAIEGRANRTGDYTGAWTDPTDDTTFWLVAEIAQRTDTGACQWGTVITKAKP